MTSANPRHPVHVWVMIFHYNGVIMGAIASQITSLVIVYSTVYSDANWRKHQSSASLAFVQGIHRGPVNSPHKWPVTWKMFPFDDVIMPQNTVEFDYLFMLWIPAVDSQSFRFLFNVYDPSISVYDPSISEISNCSFRKSTDHIHWKGTGKIVNVIASTSLQELVMWVCKLFRLVRWAVSLASFNHRYTSMVRQSPGWLIRIW